MEELPTDIIQHIGESLALEDRITCLLSNKLFRTINFKYTFQYWKHMNGHKLNALLKVKPLVSRIKIESNFSEYSSEDDLARDLTNICEKGIEIQLILNGNNQYFSSILLNRSIILTELDVCVNSGVDLNQLYDILISREDLYLDSLEILLYTKESLQKISTIGNRIKHLLYIHESSVILDGINFEGFRCISNVYFNNSICDRFNIFMEATHLSSLNIFRNNHRTCNLLDTISLSKRLRVLFIDYIDFTQFLQYEELFEKLKQVLTKTSCCLFFKGDALLNTNIIILIKMLLDCFDTRNIYLQDTSINKTSHIIKKYFIKDSRVVIWDDQHKSHCTLSFSELIASIPNKNIRYSWDMIKFYSQWNC